MYLQTVLNNKTNIYDVIMANKVLDFFQPVISQWAGSYLNDFFVAGSSAKGVSIKGKSDIERLYLRLLLVTDYICGMTDSYAKQLYQELKAMDWPWSGIF